MSPTTTANPNTDPNALPEWYDPFPEPNTIPHGWDLSEYLREGPTSSKKPIR